MGAVCNRGRAAPPLLSQKPKRLINMKLLVVFGLLCGLLVHAAQRVPSEGGSPLPRASAKPVNVDPKLDCAIKKLAWDFGNQLLPGQVNTRFVKLYAFHSLILSTILHCMSNCYKF